VPRRFDAAAEEALTRSTTTLLVVTAEIRAVAAATRVLARLRDVGPDIGLVVRGPGPTGLGADIVSDTLDLPLVAQMRNDPRLARAIDEGLGPSMRKRSTLVAASRQALERLPEASPRGAA
ncbi:MAG: septum site-determining protein Ssd, partial [Nocardioidaceae bacterium]